MRKKRDRQQANLHDSFFKSIFKDPEYAKDLLQVILPPKVLPHVRLDDITITDKELITSGGKQLRTDLLVHLPLKEYFRGIEIVLSLIFEHKSFKDPDTLIQIVTYYVELLRAQLKQLRRRRSKQLHIIVPVLILCCKDKDYAPPSTYLQWLFRGEEIPAAIKELMPWLPNMFMNIVNLRKLLSPKLWRVSKSLGIVVYGMDRRWQADDDTIAYMLEKARLLERGKAQDLLSSLRDYYDRADNEVDGEDFGRVERERWPEVKEEERFMPEIYFGFERAEREGIEKGIEQNRREAVLRMLAKGMSDADIKDVMQINTRQLAKFKRQLKN